MSNVIALHNRRHRGTAKPGVTLPPLSRRGTRVLLLASSYHDASQAAGDGTRSAGKPGSRLLVRNTLWLDGSYPDFERLLDELRDRDRVLYGRFWRAYVDQRFPTGRKLDTPSQQRDAGYGTVWLAKRMPASIYVPSDISVAAGYAPAEAAAYAKPRRHAS